MEGYVENGERCVAPASQQDGCDQEFACIDRAALDCCGRVFIFRLKLAPTAQYINTPLATTVPWLSKKQYYYIEL